MLLADSVGDKKHIDVNHIVAYIQHIIYPYYSSGSLFHVSLSQMSEDNSY